MTDSEVMKKFPVVVINERDDFLRQIMRWQLQLQEGLYGVHPGHMQLDEGIQYIHTMHTAAMAELHELMDEVGWKPWATERFINVEKARGELIDVLHFIFSIALALDMTPEMVFEKYAEKQERNRERQRVGYSGVDEKCLACKRDTEDVKAASGLDPVPVKGWKGQYCGECGRGDTWVMPS